MHDDLEPCAVDPQVKTVVNFVYDYNTDDVDYFDQQAGSVYLYVFDENDVFINRYTKHKINMWSSKPDFSMTFDANNSDIRMGKTYKFVAVATGSHVEGNNDLTTPGFKLVNEMIPGKSTLKDYILRLNRDDKMFSDFGIVDYTKDYSGSDALIDTLWTTKPDQVQVHTIPYLKAEFDSPNQIPDHVEEVRIPMMRITNNINVALTSRSFTEETKPEDYDILLYFPHGNGTIDFVGEVLTDISQPLYYRALRKKVDIFEEKESRAPSYQTEYAIYATFGVSRLKYEDECSLQIRNPETHEIIAEIPNFSKYLSDEGNLNYNDPQEYLDREYNFEINIGLDMDKLWWTQVGLGVLGWSEKHIWTSL